MTVEDPEMDPTAELPEALRDWVDIDVAEFIVGKALNVFPSNSSMHDFWTKYKKIFWSDNVVGNGLYRIIEAMRLMGLLEVRNGPRYRWARKFELPVSNNVDYEDRS